MLYLQKSACARPRNVIHILMGAADSTSVCSTGPSFPANPFIAEVTTRVQYGWFESTVPNVDQEAFSLRLEGFFTPQESGIHTLALSAVGWARLYLDDKLVIDHSSDSDMAKQITADLKLEGGKAYPIKVEYYWRGSPRWRALSFGHQPPHAKDMIAEAVKLAKNSDVVVLIAGLNGEWEVGRLRPRRHETARRAE